MGSSPIVSTIDPAQATDDTGGWSFALDGEPPRASGPRTGHSGRRHPTGTSAPAGAVVVGHKLGFERRRDHNHGDYAWGRWVGMSYDGAVISGWGAMARTEDKVRAVVQDLIDTEGASSGRDS